MEWLPDSVLKIAHLIPTYYYISTNEALKTLEEFNFETLKPLIGNMLIILGFAFIFTLFANIYQNKRN